MVTKKPPNGGYLLRRGSYCGLNPVGKTTFPFESAICLTEPVILTPGIPECADVVIPEALKTIKSKE